MFPRYLERTFYIGSGSRSGDTDNGIIFIRSERLHIVPPSLRVVFRSFDSIADSLVSAGDEADEHVMDTVGGRNLRSVHYSEPSACTGSNIENSSAPLGPFDYPVDKFFDLRNYGLDGDGDRFVLGIYGTQDFSGGHLLQMIVMRSLLSYSQLTHFRKVLSSSKNTALFKGIGAMIEDQSFYRGPHYAGKLHPEFFSYLHKDFLVGVPESSHNAHAVGRKVILRKGTDEE